jgi:DnaJ-class molecular chaperone
MTYYDILGISNNATSSEIKTAYRQKAKTLHPDMNKEKDTSKEFLKLQEAYDVLKDDVKRKEYDYKLNTSSRSSSNRSNTFTTDDFFYNNDYNDFYSNDINIEDLIKQYYQNQESRKRPNYDDFFTHNSKQDKEEETVKNEKELDLYEVITLEQAINGGVIELKIDNACDLCLNKNGKHYLVRKFQTIFGIQEVEEEINCHQGRCDYCDKKLSKETVKIRLPNSGIADGDTLILRTNGYKIKLHLSIKTTKNISFQKQDIILIKNISKKKSIQGGSCLVTTPQGKIKLKIPSNVSNGQKFKLNGRGIETRQGKGNMIIIINVSN